jgi:hypothetical protein
MIWRRRGSGKRNWSDDKKRKRCKNHMGSSIDDFLKEEGVFEER